MRTIQQSTTQLRSQTTMVEPLWFIQMKVQGIWVFMYPLVRIYGYKTIESCEEAISELEILDEKWDMEPEYRLKEELI